MPPGTIIATISPPASLGCFRSDRVWRVMWPRSLSVIRRACPATRRNLSARDSFFGWSPFLFFLFQKGMLLRSKGVVAAFAFDGILHQLADFFCFRVPGLAMLFQNFTQAFAVHFLFLCCLCTCILQNFT